MTLYPRAAGTSDCTIVVACVMLCCIRECGGGGIKIVEWSDPFGYRGLFVLVISNNNSVYEKSLTAPLHFCRGNQGANFGMLTFGLANNISLQHL